ncbi:MAG: hypothetical protein M1812_001926 [Candelaria pacifica]|nr:MAG: hypothetical protein M1812_001926 [Candelaria pacifica]
MESEKTSSFLTLPRELRDQIYTELLHPRSLFYLPTAFHDTFPLSIILTNRQIHDEATPIFYGQNTFIIEVDQVSPPIQNSLAVLLGTQYAHLVRNFLIRILDEEGVPQKLQTLCELLGAGPRLHRLIIVTYLEHCRTFIAENMGMFRALHGRVQRVSYVWYGSGTVPESERKDQSDLTSLKNLLEGPKEFPIFRLPREIRDEIYGLLLVERHSWAVTQGFHYTFPKAILLASKQFHEEAIKAFYRTNDLRLEISYDWRVPEKILNAYSQHPVYSLEIEIRIDTRNPETDYEHMAPFYAPFPALPDLLAGIRRNVQAACEILATGPRLRQFTLEWWDKQETGAWSAKRMVLEPLTLLRGVGKVHIDRGWDLIKLDETEHPGGNSTKDSDFEWLKMIMEKEVDKGGICTFGDRDSKMAFSKPDGHS